MIRHYWRESVTSINTKAVFIAPKEVLKPEENRHVVKTEQTLPYTM